MIGPNVRNVTRLVDNLNENTKLNFFFYIFQT